MNYYVNLFSPETAEIFSRSGKNISGFRLTKKTYVENRKIGPGDRFICYVTRIQRFIGVLEVVSDPFVDSSPIFDKENDPFVLRFKVKPMVWLPLEKALPIHDKAIWNNLSFTKGLGDDSNNWTYMVFSSPNHWPTGDCVFLEKKLLGQAEDQVDFPFSEDDQKKLKPQKIKLPGKKAVAVTIPEDEEVPDTAEQTTPKDSERESLIVQSKLAEVGEKLGFKIWLPRNDRAAIIGMWKPRPDSLLEELPFSFDDATTRTIKNIDVLWVKGRTIARAFEVEGTTSIYSGILRMADLLSLVPNIEIKIHIVAPDGRREEVFKQISRPVFAIMEKAPLAELCTFISYSSVYELASEKRLDLMKESVVDEYEEASEE